LGVGSLEEALQEGFMLVDIREPREVATHPAPAAQVRHMPMAEVLHGTPGLEVTGPTLLICATGRRSLATAQVLRERGHEQVYSLRGGLAGLATKAAALG
jgi:adenylyltransferase/sulfurtransferase